MCFPSTGPVSCEFIQCGIPGQCVGILEYQQTAQTQTDCEVSSIKANFVMTLFFDTAFFLQADAILYGDIAEWYTYNNADSLCLLFSTCESTSEFCSDCVSGNPACIIEEDLPPLQTGKFEMHQSL